MRSEFYEPSLFVRSPLYDLLSELRYFLRAFQFRFHKHRIEKELDPDIYLEELRVGVMLERAGELNKTQLESLMSRGLEVLERWKTGPADDFYRNMKRNAEGEESLADHYFEQRALAEHLLGLVKSYVEEYPTLKRLMREHTLSMIGYESFTAHNELLRSLQHVFQPLATSENSFFENPSREALAKYLAASEAILASKAYESVCEKVVSHGAKIEREKQEELYARLAAFSILEEDSW